MIFAAVGHELEKSMNFSCAACSTAKYVLLSPSHSCRMLLRILSGFSHTHLPLPAFSGFLLQVDHHRHCFNIFHAYFGCGFDSRIDAQWSNSVSGGHIFLPCHKTPLANMFWPLENLTYLSCDATITAVPIVRLATNGALSILISSPWNLSAAPSGSP